MYSRKHWIVVASITLALASCARPELPVPAPTQAAAPVPTFASDLVSTPTSAAPQLSEPIARSAIPPIATTPPAFVFPSPYPTWVPIRTRGPYFAFKVTGSSCHQALFVVDQDGIGRSQLTLPGDCSFSASIPQDVSPNGDYLVAHLGRINDPLLSNDYRLGVIDLRTGLFRWEVPLLSSNYPNDLYRLFEATGGSHGGLSEFDAFRDAVVQNMSISRWSPNGRYLAFGGQSNGPSSDLYVLDNDTGQVRRLTDGPEQIVEIAWSPDGRRVLNGSASNFSPNRAMHYYSVDLQGDTNVPLGESINGIARWVNSEKVLHYSSTDSGDVVNRSTFSSAYLVDVVTGNQVELWPGGFSEIIFGELEGRAVVYGCPSVEASDSTNCGRYLVDLESGASVAAPIEVGEEFGLPPTCKVPVLDRMGNWLFVCQYNVEVYDRDRRLVATAPKVGTEWERIAQFALAPDREHAFLLIDGWVAVADLTTGVIRYIDQGPFVGDSLEYAWITVSPAPDRPPDS